MSTTTTETMDPRNVRPAHEVRDADKLRALTAAMEADGWQGRAILAYRYTGRVCALTGSHRLAAAVAAGVEEIPVLVIEDEAVEDGEYADSGNSSGDVLRGLADLTTLPTVLRDLGVEADAIALADAEDC